MKLSVWAKQQGISYKTAWRLWEARRLPVPARQLPTGTIVLDVEGPPVPQRPQTVLYARVSGSGQKDDLERQVARLEAHAAVQGWSEVRVVREIGSGLAPDRTRLLRVLRDPRVGRVVVLHRDRLARFGAEYIEAALQAEGRELVVIEPVELRDDLVQDMIDVLTSFCARLYGRRSARQRAEAAARAASSER